MPDYNNEIRSEEVQEILTAVPHWMIRWGNVVITLLLLMLIIMSWIIKYPDIVPAEITITTRMPPEKLVAHTSGRIEKIFVNNQGIVGKSTPLAVIENTARFEDIFKLKEITDTFSFQHGSAAFPFNELHNLNLGEVGTALALFEKDYTAYELNKNLEPYMVEGSAQRFEANQLKQRLSYLFEQKEISDKELILKKAELERYKKLFDRGVIATQEWESKNLEYLRVQKDVKNLQSSISTMKSSINDIEKNSATTKINETKDQVNLFRNTLQSYSNLKKAIGDWELKYLIKSSIAGEVSFLQIWKENQVISEGENVFTIIPKNEEQYIGKLKALSQNSGKLKKGQIVNIRLANYPDREFGILTGKIEYISLTPDKEGKILADVSLPQKLYTSYHKKIAFQQEMVGTADVVTEDLRLIERVLYQFRDVFK